MRKLDVKEIHGYHAAQGLKLIKPSVLAGRQAPKGRPTKSDRVQVKQGGSTMEAFFRVS